MGVPFHFNGIFPDKPSSYWGTPMTMETPICVHIYNTSHNSRNQTSRRCSLEINTYTQPTRQHMTDHHGRGKQPQQPQGELCIKTKTINKNVTREQNQTKWRKSSLIHVVASEMRHVFQWPQFPVPLLNRKKTRIWIWIQKYKPTAVGDTQLSKFLNLPRFLWKWHHLAVQLSIYRIFDGET